MDVLLEELVRILAYLNQRSIEPSEGRKLKIFEERQFYRPRNKTLWSNGLSKECSQRGFGDQKLEDHICEASKQVLNKADH